MILDNDSDNEIGLRLKVPVLTGFPEYRGSRITCVPDYMFPALCSFLMFQNLLAHKVFWLNTIKAKKNNCVCT